jgi:ornithine cyclodeaminase/alanine dehydrogenase-like protein (mu-crystallin family)
VPPLSRPTPWPDPDASVLAILGGGVQGRSHLDAFTRIRDFREIRIASRIRAYVETLAAGHPSARAVAEWRGAVEDAPAARLVARPSGRAASA